MSGKTFRTKFDFGDRVFIDRDSSLAAVVVGFQFFPASGHKIAVSWFKDGKLEEEMIWVDRVTEAT